MNVYETNESPQLAFSSSSSTGSQPQAASAGPPSSATFRRGSPSKAGARPISGAFTLDLEKIESTVENMGEGGVRLVNHNLDEIFNDGPVRLPQTMTARQVLERALDGQVMVVENLEIYLEMAKLLRRWEYGM